jgi:hypothetical protein
MPPRLRLVVSMLACVLGPALAGLVVGVGSSLLALLTGNAAMNGGSVLALFPALLAWAAFPVVFGTVPMLLIGLPIQAWMQRRGVTGLLWHVAPAALAGGLMFLTILVAAGAFGFAYGALYGGLAGAFAWAIRRPDRDALYDTPKTHAA